jgi:hypothetical protein
MLQKSSTTSRCEWRTPALFRSWLFPFWFGSIEAKEISDLLDNRCPFLGCRSAGPMPRTNSPCFRSKVANPRRRQLGFEVRSRGRHRRRCPLKHNKTWPGLRKPRCSRALAVPRWIRWRDNAILLSPWSFRLFSCFPFQPTHRHSCRNGGFEMLGSGSLSTKWTTYLGLLSVLSTAFSPVCRCNPKSRILPKSASWLDLFSCRQGAWLEEMRPVRLLQA